MLDNNIYVEQYAFVPDRSILDNVMTAFDIIHYLKNKHKGKKGEVALKIDMSKAYDRVDCNYMLLDLNKLGFHDVWVWVGLRCALSLYLIQLL